MVRRLTFAEPYAPMCAWSAADRPASSLRLPRRGAAPRFNFGGKRVVGGIPWEFVERLASLGGAIADLPKGNVPFEAEVYRRVAREMLEEAGVRCLWQTSVCGAPELSVGGAISAVTLSTAGFLSRLEADVFIDCERGVHLLQIAGDTASHGQIV